mgnify:CR=1 FL=1
MGGSAGGLLMGAVVNEKPDLFLGMIMAVPFVDSLTTNLDHSLPLTIGEFDEFGNAKDNQDHLINLAIHDSRTWSFAAPLRAASSIVAADPLMSGAGLAVRTFATFGRLSGLVPLVSSRLILVR